LVALPDCNDSSIATALDHVLHGEAGSANQEGTQLARRNLRLLLQEGGYEAAKVYNQDKSGTFWRQMPTRTRATGKRVGSKKEKERAGWEPAANFKNAPDEVREFWEFKGKPCPHS
jgi:hypothetical protein